MEADRASRPVAKCQRAYDVNTGDTDTCGTVLKQPSDSDVMYTIAHINKHRMNDEIFLTLFSVFRCVRHGCSLYCKKCSDIVHSNITNIYWHISQCCVEKNIKKLYARLREGGTYSVIKIGRYNSNGSSALDNQHRVFIHAEDLLSKIPQLLVLNISGKLVSYLDDIDGTKPIGTVKIKSSISFRYSIKYRGEHLMINSDSKCFAGLLTKIIESNLSCLFCDQMYDCLPSMETIIEHLRNCLI